MKINAKISDPNEPCKYLSPKKKIKKILDKVAQESLIHGHSALLGSIKSNNFELAHANIEELLKTKAFDVVNFNHFLPTEEDFKNAYLLTPELHKRSFGKENNGIIFRIFFTNFSTYNDLRREIYKIQSAFPDNKYKITIQVLKEAVGHFNAVIMDRWFCNTKGIERAIKGELVCTSIDGNEVQICD